MWAKFKKSTREQWGELYHNDPEAWGDVQATGSAPRRLTRGGQSMKECVELLFNCYLAFKCISYLIFALCYSTIPIRATVVGAVLLAYSYYRRPGCLLASGLGVRNNSCSTIELG